ncbi:MAG: glycine--tRNA ligase [Planctomycetaceae bacterium]|nr:glycine--tRNA ligase [Planctomycetaceae bacterium]
MEKLVSLCKRRGFLFQSSEIYGGLNGFWDYGPLGVELKRNVKDAWWRDMVSGHDDLSVMSGAPDAYEMTGLDCTIIMHPQVWKCSGHYDLFCDMMSNCEETKKLYRFDHIKGRFAEYRGTRIFVTTDADGDEGLAHVHNRALKFFGVRRSKAAEIEWGCGIHGGLRTGRHVVAQVTPGTPYTDLRPITDANDWAQILAPHAEKLGTLAAPREFNLMFKTTVGALGDSDKDAAFLRPETAQGIFVNFKNVVDSTRVRVPFGIAQIGKSFRNEITPRNFTFRSREFEQMEIEFFCHPDSSPKWYQYWRDRRMQWYTDLGLAGERLQLREHEPEELSHYSCGTADIEYAFPFLPTGEYGELEGVAHRGDFDLKSHMEGKLDPDSKPDLKLELDADGKPKWRGSGKDLTYRDDLTNERFTPHVIEPSAGADRATLAFLCEAYTEDEAPDDKGKMQTRVVMKLHPRIAPIKAAVFPLVKKDGMPEIAKDIYRALKPNFNVFYDEKGAVGRRYRRQDEAGTPYCITVDGQTVTDQTVTIRDRDSLEQWRVKVDDCVDEIRQRMS